MTKKTAKKVEEEAPEKSEKGKEKFDKTIEEKKRVEVIKKFTKEVLKKYGSTIRAVVLFGSSA